MEKNSMLFPPKLHEITDNQITEARAEHDAWVADMEASFAEKSAVRFLPRQEHPEVAQWTNANVTEVK